MSSPKLTVFLVKIFAVLDLFLAWMVLPYDKSAAIYWAVMAGFMALIGVFMAHAVNRSNG